MAAVRRNPIHAHQEPSSGGLLSAEDRREHVLRDLTRVGVLAATRPSEILKNADAFVAALVVALTDCADTNHVEVADECTPYVSE